MMIAVDIKTLFDLEQFKQEMDEYARKVRQMMPLPGLDRALLPGAIEWEREHEWAQEGIPIGSRHSQALRKVAELYDLTCPV